MANINRSYAYKFLGQIIDKYPDDSIGIMKDLIVDYFLFPSGDESDMQFFSENDKKIASLMHESRKIEAIKFCQEVNNLSLNESKKYIESRYWPASGGNNLELHKKYVDGIIKKIAEDFQIPLKNN